MESNGITVDRRVLYNTLRLHYLEDSDLDVEPWQVADYRKESTESLIEQLASFDIHLDPSSFTAYAEHCDSPEALTDEFLADGEVEPEVADYIYLLIFELWRRLMPERQTMSLFCDELDHRIEQFEREELPSHEPLEDAIANLQYILDEEVDDGADPRDVFETVKHSCAHDVEDFLYHFVDLQIDNNNLIYASDVLEGFNDYVDDPKWFALLKARLLFSTEPEEAADLVEHLIELTADETDINFHLEFLSSLVQEGNHQTFRLIAERVIALLKTQGEFQDLLSICEDYFHCLDDEESERAVQSILTKRNEKDPSAKINASESDIAKLKTLLNQ